MYKKKLGMKAITAITAAALLSSNVFAAAAQTQAAEGTVAEIEAETESSEEETEESVKVEETETEEETEETETEVDNETETPAESEEDEDAVEKTEETSETETEEEETEAEDVEKEEATEDREENSSEEESADSQVIEEEAEPVRENTAFVNEKPSLMTMEETEVEKETREMVRVDVSFQCQGEEVGRYGSVVLNSGDTLNEETLEEFLYEAGLADEYELVDTEATVENGGEIVIEVSLIEEETEQTVGVNYWDVVNNKQAGEGSVTVAADAYNVNVSDLTDVPEGYELVSTGDVGINDGWIYVEVRPTAGEMLSTTNRQEKAK